MAAGIVYSYSENAVYGHAGFNIDWGPGTDGTQDPPGHRNAIMSVSGNYTNVGYAVVAESNPTTQVGPQVITGNLCYAEHGSANHYNRFLVGTVWIDSNGNGQYDPGEGIGGVRVEPDQGDFFAVTANSGGYAIPITAAGDYTVTFSGSIDHDTGQPHGHGGFNQRAPGSEIRRRQHRTRGQHRLSHLRHAAARRS